MIHYYKQVIQSHCRHEDAQDLIVSLMYWLLWLALPCFLVCLSLVLSEQGLLLFQLISFYLLLAYNFPTLCQEYCFKRFSTYHVMHRSRRHLFLYLLCENNPLLGLAGLYILFYVIVNSFSLYRLGYMFYALFWVIVILTVIWLPYSKKVIGIVAAGISFYLVWTDPCWMIGGQFILLIYLVAIFSYSYRGISMQAVSRHRIRKKIAQVCLQLFLLPFYELVRDFPKTAVRLFTSFMCGILCRIFDMEEIAFFPFFLLLDVELSLDRKYKHIPMFVQKYYFLQKSQLSFLQRYCLSDNYAYFFKHHSYLWLFSIGKGTSFMVVIGQVLTMLCLSLIYHQAEEKTFATSKKVNHYLFQYFIFLALAAIAYVLQRV